MLHAQHWCHRSGKLWCWGPSERYFWRVRCALRLFLILIIGVLLITLNFICLWALWFFFSIEFSERQNPKLGITVVVMACKAPFSPPLPPLLPTFHGKAKHWVFLRCLQILLVTKPLDGRANFRWKHSLCSLLFIASSRNLSIWRL